MCVWVCYMLDNLELWTANTQYHAHIDTKRDTTVVSGSDFYT